MVSFQEVLKAQDERFAEVNHRMDEIFQAFCELRRISENTWLQNSERENVSPAIVNPSFENDGESVTGK